MHPTKPISPYGVTKLTLENYASLYAATNGPKYICVRPANAYGIGQRPFNGQGFIATAIASVIKNQSIKIFGEKGTVRDYLYVSDLAPGIVHALEKGHLSEIYNIGSGVGLSNLDVIDAINLLMKNNNKNPVFVEKLAERPFDVKSNILDSAKLKSHTGWGPSIDFNNGLCQTYQWMMGELKCH
jgi:UDP-glucose 4-epimerase